VVDTSRLELQWRLRPGSGSHTERRYLDFVVDGVPLCSRLGIGDHVTVLGCWPPEDEREHIKQLLAASGRVPLYVCAECGGLDCGALTVLIERAQGGFVWRDFAFGNSYDPKMTDVDSYRGVGPFVFNKTEYWQLFHGRRVTLV
jgi:hypothetical protein